MQHYGISNVWLSGDGVTRAILIVLATMSVLSWAVVFAKGATLTRVRQQSAVAERRFWTASTYDEGIALLGKQIENPYRDLAIAGREASEQIFDAQQLLIGSLNRNEWVSRCLKVSLDDYVARLQRGTAILASVGSTAPFVGLFGTVWGIYHALMAIGASAQASLDHVAGPVGESLIMTAFGLFVAIPAVLGYNGVSRGNKAVVHKLVRFTHEVHGYFVVGGKVSAQGTGERRTSVALRGVSAPLESGVAL
ncbi:motA/TolQ/ExbB proton channel family protein [Paraburkholderia xenovorans LB400]|uniref:Biopolymer transport protein ExbB n=1 Tax=Paraburkholderia xenovorans (strain LB400) TaxID=266265 RepID=Q13G69_PARXL|nr:MotA/TolQ/ExbB proton channel family protein [Paraburkholderia xenovorans]ABE36920.1 outer membrane transport energization protein ExbB [Paraburkholderia xenovorans LB400]AIP35123.1 motA/TolQ/ExbB proton channel family protein [Paraburkholderia xenovorans LB400]